MPEVRQFAQEVISAHVLEDNVKLRDRLIDEYVAEHGDVFLRCIFDFVHFSAVSTVTIETAEQSFYFMLDGLGTLLETVAGEVDVPVPVLVLNLATAEHEADVPREKAAALKAAQTCLLIHMLVRQGHEAWGVQKTLDLNDMCAVVDVFGDLMWTFVAAASELLGDAFVVRALLDGVESLLERDAHEEGVTVHELIQRYWAQLSLSECPRADDSGTS